MFSLILAVSRCLRSALMLRSDLMLEYLALRHQLIVLQRRSEKPPFHRADRLLWVALQAVWTRSSRLDPLDRGLGHRPAPNGDPLAPRWVPTLLALAIAAPRRPAADRSKTDRLDPASVDREPNVGQPTHPGRVGQAGSTGFRLHHSQAPFEGGAAVVANLADVPAQSRRANCRGRFLHRPDRNFSSVFRLRHPGS